MATYIVGALVVLVAVSYTHLLAIAQKSNPSPVGAFGVKDECDMELLGYLAFLDPPKESTADAIKALKAVSYTHLDVYKRQVYNWSQ